MTTSTGLTPLLRRAGLWTLGLAAVGGVIASRLGTIEWGTGVAFGALVGWLNLRLLARAIDRMLDNPAAVRPVGRQTWVLPGVMLLKWPFVLLALAFILWYMPARPEGVALGILFSLIGVSIAALRANRGHHEPLTPSSDRTPSDHHG